jgi:AraC-like DNA-binding protein
VTAAFFRFNPPFAQLPQCSAVLNGIAQHYHVQHYCTSLTLKSVVRGAALYVTRQGRHLVTEDTFLVLNHGQEYSLEFQGKQATTETLSPFFQRGFVEHIAYSVATPAVRQLDEITQDTPIKDFCERLYPRSGRIASLLGRLHRGLQKVGDCSPWLEDQFFALGAALVELRHGVHAEIDQFPAQRPSTRVELYRRLHRGRDFLSSCCSEPVSVAMAAKASHLSPYHFHRMFKLAFHQTPMQFVQECRLTRARRLIEGTDQPITSVCFAVGFESPGSFSWLFRKRFGLSPRQLRAQHLQR